MRAGEFIGDLFFEGESIEYVEVSDYIAFFKNILEGGAEIRVLHFHLVTKQLAFHGEVGLELLLTDLVAEGGALGSYQGTHHYYRPNNMPPSFQD